MDGRGMRAAVAVASLVLVLAGCTSVSPRIIEDSIVRVAVDAPMTTLNPASLAASGSANAAVAWLTHGQFVDYDADAQPVPDESFGTATVLPGDAFTVRYTLAESATWSDGEPVGSADLLLAWAAASGALDGLLAPTERFEGERTVPLADPALFPALGEDGRSLTVYFASEVEGWEWMLDPRVPAHSVGQLALGITDPDEAREAVSAAILGKNAEALGTIAAVWNTAFDAPARSADLSVAPSSGPYTVESWSESSVTLVANASYRGSRQPRVDRIELVTIPDPLDAVSALDSGAVDIITPAPTPEVQDAVLAIDDVTVLTGADPAVEHLDLQIVGGRSGVFADARVREAFLLTVPRQQIVTELVGGIVEDAAPQSSFLVSQASADYAALVSENGSVKYAEPDTAAAAALLREARVSSPEVCVLFDAQDENRLTEFGLIAASAAEAGFVVTDCSTPDVAASLGKTGAYDAALFAWTVPEPSTQWVAELYSSMGSTNLTGYSSAEVDRLVDQLESTSEKKAQNELIADIDAELWADGYGVPLYQHAALTAFGAKVAGVSRSALVPGVFWNATDWAPAAER